MTRVTAVLAVVAALARPHPADAARITVLSSNAVRAAYADLIPAFEKNSGHRVVMNWAGAAELKNRVNAGAEADLIITPSADVDELVTNGKVVTGTRIDLAKSVIGVAVRSGAPKPDLSSWESLQPALL